MKNPVKIVNLLENPNSAERLKGIRHISRCMAALKFVVDNSKYPDTKRAAVAVLSSHLGRLTDVGTLATVAMHSTCENESLLALARLDALEAVEELKRIIRYYVSQPRGKFAVDVSSAPGSPRWQPEESGFAEKLKAILKQSQQKVGQAKLPV
jgi:hypothetical protein